MQSDLAGKFRVQATQEPRKLLVTVPAVALTDDLALQDLQSGEQAGGAVSLVVVGIVPRRPFFMGNPGCVRSNGERVDALYVQAGSRMVGRLHEIAALALKHRLPMMSPVEEFVIAGGLMSYSPSPRENYRRAAGYVSKIPKGAKPGDLPIEQPMKFELVINLKTPKALDLTIPQSIFLRADRVIE